MRRKFDPEGGCGWLIAGVLIVIAFVILFTVRASEVKAADGGLVSSEISGVATWYDAPTMYDAAAGPALRAWLGPKWRGQWVTVIRGNPVAVHLTDFCECRPRLVNGTLQPTLVDLDDQAFGQLAPLGAGVIEVEVGIPVITIPKYVPLPPTDTAEDPGWTLAGFVAGGCLGLVSFVAGALTYERIRRRERH